MYEYTDRIRQEVSTVILGKDEIVRKVLMAILARGHVLLEDVPGVGKTTLAMAFAKTLGLTTRRVQFTSDTMPSDIIGFSVYDRNTGTLEYKPGAVMTNMFLADEINRTSSKTQSALLEAMAEQQVTVDGVTRPLPDPFIVLATQNPVGSAGTMLLPSSQMDRFIISCSMGYPDKKSQSELMKERHSADPLQAVKPVTDIDTLRRMIAAAQETHMADAIYDYISDITEATRSDSRILLGISPRGALACCRAAKAYAFMAGRDYVTPDDAAAVIPDVFGHRLVLTSKARLHECTASGLITEILNTVPQPGVREFLK